MKDLSAQTDSLDSVQVYDLLVTMELTDEHRQRIESPSSIVRKPNVSNLNYTSIRLVNDRTSFLLFKKYIDLLHIVDLYQPFKLNGPATNNHIPTWPQGNIAM